MKKNKNIKKVYVGFAADILHEGHINILKKEVKVVLIEYLPYLVFFCLSNTKVCCESCCKSYQSQSYQTY